MIRLLKNRLALSTVVTTLIILVVSILLASVLTYFAVNVVSTRVQEENLSVTKQHIWVTSTGVAQGAIMVTNTGGRDVVINKIAVRGQAADWTTDVFWLSATSADTGFNNDLPYSATTPAVGVAITGFTENLAAPLSSGVILPSGQTMVIYITNPDAIGLTDIGLTVGIAAHSAQAVYYSEVNIQAAP